MIVPVFVDTNVFVYRFDTTEPAKQRRASQWLDYLWQGRLGSTSTQVQHELYATLTRKLTMPRDEARQIVATLQAWQPVVVDRSVVQEAWGLEDRFSLSWWDALIVAAAQAAGARILLSEDLQTGAAYGSVEVVNPFTLEPPSRGVHEEEPPQYD